MIDVEGLVAVAVLLFWIWALLDCIATDSGVVRNLPKMVWVVIVLLLPLIGSFAWLLLGRPEKANWRPGSTDYSAPRRPVGLEDSPRYSSMPSITDRRSAELDQELDRWQSEQDAKAAAAPASDAVPAPGAHQELDAWEAKLQEREAELRRRELEIRQRELDQRELEQRERELDE
jgi:hypothetical protein